ncbi:hypothetical protein NIES2119_14435 [[Phormidium ambiguum] IAM M-71]|uniref:Uncharacterized protein n=1 Tax=[Phormidium ambiguum] IAM M-71 TaxID=454136 RepID=A0A1U7IIU2_9CYAN|nr:hypothetical protein NIES2119_14435 [Phormidium ambiguum IAM M-71]
MILLNLFYRGKVRSSFLKPDLPQFSSTNTGKDCCWRKFNLIWYSNKQSNRDCKRFKKLGKTRQLFVMLIFRQLQCEVTLI